MKILESIYDCYIVFGCETYYTAANFSQLGRTIEDAEEQLGFVRGWTDIGDPTSTEYRWEALRRHADGCQISHVFYKYLGKTTPAPERLPPYQPNAGNRL